MVASMTPHQPELPTPDRLPSDAITEAAKPLIDQFGTVLSAAYDRGIREGIEAAAKSCEASIATIRQYAETHTGTHDLAVALGAQIEVLSALRDCFRLAQHI